MRRGLTFNNSPAFSVPLRFFLNVPVFALLAAALLLWAGPDALVSRWNPVTLAVTHLFTLGVLASAMVGALMQILPVATNASVWRPLLTATVVHALLTLGTLILVAAFLVALPWLFKLAMLLLVTAFLWLLFAVLFGLRLSQHKAAPQSAQELLAVRLAMTALFATVVLGGTLASALGWQLDAPLILLTHLHSTWGLLGWVGILLMGISFQVIPIFQVTELYPARLTRWLTSALFCLLALWTACMLWLPDTATAITRGIEILLMLAYMIYAGCTFYLLWTRKRAVADTTTLFWRTAMLAIAASALLWVTGQLTGIDFSVPIGLLFIVGFAWSAINGMLYKILPFLIWYHAQKELQIALRLVPKVKQIIPDNVAMRQFWVHALSLILLLAAMAWPALLRPAAAVLALSGAWLTVNIVNALRLYARTRKAIKLALKVT